MELQNRGVSAVITGSWARGEATATSDIDFLIVSCPTPLKCKIESRAEDTLGSSKFDVIYRDDARPLVLQALEANTLTLEKLETTRGRFGHKALTEEVLRGLRGSLECLYDDAACRLPTSSGFPSR